MNEAEAGWQTDEISNGTFTLTQSENGELDVLFVDSRNKPISTMGDGGVVRLLRRDDDNISVIVVYQSVIEIYTFFREKNGAIGFTLLQNKALAELKKSSLMQGDCDAIHFERLKKKP